jgi:hypothetical protein
MTRSTRSLSWLLVPAAGAVLLVAARAWPEPPPRSGDPDPGSQFIPQAGSTTYPNPGPIEPGGEPVTAKTDLAGDQPVEIQWGQSWWAGTVVALEPDGRVKVHYTGWSPANDELAPRDRLRLAAAKPAVSRAAAGDGHPLRGMLQKSVQVTLDGGRVLAGTCVGCTDKFLTLTLSSGQTAVVSTEKIVYVLTADAPK